MTPIFQKRLCPQRKLKMTKIFWNRDFNFRRCHGPFWIYSDQKIKKNFLRFLTCDPISQKRQCQVIMGYSFEIEIFVLKYVLDYSESIQTKKSTKNFCLCHFFDLWPHFFQKMALLSNNENFFRNREICFRISFGQLWIDTDQKKIFPQKIFFFAIFRPKMAKSRVFLKVFSRKIFFLKNFVPSLWTFYCDSFELSNSYVPLTFAEIYPSKSIPSPLTSGVHESGLTRLKTRGIF